VNQRPRGGVVAVGTAAGVVPLGPFSSPNSFDDKANPDARVVPGMGFHTFPVERADDLDDVSRYASLSVDELVFALDPDPGTTVADLGSGVGFYTDDVAPFVGQLYAVDVQPAMHEAYRERGVPENVDPVTAGVDDLPFADDELDAAFSTMTYHEFHSEAALDETARVLRPDGRLVLADWTATGEGARGPPIDERFSAPDVVDHLESRGFTVERADDRPETFLVTARA
jgi:SAM-dependent methyltransferase